MVDNAPPPQDVYTVSRLNREVKLLLESGFPLLWVEGEVSNLARPRSGHIYFSLKDSEAQVRCAMFRNRNLHLRFRPADGTRVIARVRVSLYPARGEFQLIVEHMEPAGDGALRQAFEQLKARLDREGLFAAERKRALPSRIRRLGVVTSPTGAAIRDVLHVLRRRFPGMHVIVYPVPVQGEGAAEAIAARLAQAGRRGEVDTVLLTRGGGSLEDLWAFNEEVLARAIAACPLPVVSAVGHEVDVTISDLVADQRAPTPSAAAELLSPDAATLRQAVVERRRRLIAAMRDVLHRRRTTLTGVDHRLRLQHPGRRLQERAQRLDELEQRLAGAQRRAIATRRQHLAGLARRLAPHDPRRRIPERRERVDELTRRLGNGVRRTLAAKRTGLTHQMHALQAVSPLATLERGYAIVADAGNGVPLRDATEAGDGTRVLARLSRGELLCRVESHRPAGGETLLPAPDNPDSTA
ncbi:Exodeoxyribonuclease 7 large subunit [wastewater metagenome]|uniref:Exodeoxyribonuclease 7 large subunit n=2 Tax=unclassified sequences TaxID=12908 RepID=A0A5B8R516_9ZZZZ|nr:exodeoxyribonuclease VII large subunit [Arhodomonas sp. KWT]QEA03829.1 exodeoxyribonuclease 7 large subunit [uncultured organism]